MKNFLRNLQYSIYRFMQGRNGYDQLNYALLALYILMALVVRSFIKENILYSALEVLVIFLIFYRAFSRKIYKRQKENLAFMNLTRPIRSWFKVIKLNLKEKQYKHMQCPRCHRTLRVPRGRGKIEVTCPHCKIEFTRKS